MPWLRDVGVAVGLGGGAGEFDPTRRSVKAQIGELHPGLVTDRDGPDAGQLRKRHSEAARAEQPVDDLAIGLEQRGLLEAHRGG